MSRKKTNKSYNSLFASNISKLASDNGGKYAFAEAIGVVYDSVRRWCNGDNLPDGKQLMLIHEKFGVSLDWLVIGIGPQKAAVAGIAEQEAGYGCESLDSWPEDIKNACRQLREILLSDHPVIKPALLSNLAAFQHSVSKEKSQEEEIRKLSRRLLELEQWHKAEQNTGAERAALSSTGKPET
jgi:transcriptional regulator with XRE-family HTH domain